jgi:soluble lytic murein transglycosylase-like protein
MKLSVLPLLLACSAVAGTAAECALVYTVLNPSIPDPPSVVLLETPKPPKDALHPNVHAIIRRAAAKHNVPAEFVRSIVMAESAMNCDAVSSKGAIGLMQLMPETASEYGADPTIPEQNVEAGTRYLRVLLDRYHRYKNGMARAVAAYNAGPGVVDRYRGVPPYKETRGYVKRVLGFFKQFQKESAKEASVERQRQS